MGLIPPCLPETQHPFTHSPNLFLPVGGVEVVVQVFAQSTLAASSGSGPATLFMGHLRSRDRTVKGSKSALVGRPQKRPDRRGILLLSVAPSRQKNPCSPRYRGRRLPTGLLNPPR